MASDIAPRPIAWAGAVIGATVMAGVGVVFLLLRLWDTPPDTSRAQAPVSVEIPGPTLQSAPQVDLQQYRADKQRQLHSAAWVDAPHGVARIPIADAMALLVASAARAASAPAPAASSPGVAR